MLSPFKEIILIKKEKIIYNDREEMEIGEQCNKENKKFEFEEYVDECVISGILQLFIRRRDV